MKYLGVVDVCCKLGVSYHRTLYWLHVTFRAGEIYRACVFFQAEDGIRDLVRSRGLGDVYKRQAQGIHQAHHPPPRHQAVRAGEQVTASNSKQLHVTHLSLIHI